MADRKRKPRLNGETLLGLFHESEADHSLNDSTWATKGAAGRARWERFALLVLKRLGLALKPVKKVKRK